MRHSKSVEFLIRGETRFMISSIANASSSVVDPNKAE
jgi:hypothetical protein